MRQERPDINMTHRHATFFLSRVVNDGDQPVTVLTDIEDHIAIHIIGIFEDLTHLHEIPPSSFGSNPVPGSDFFGSVRKLLFGPDQVLACDNVHGTLSRGALAYSRRRKRRTSFSIYFAKCKVVKENLSICKVST